MRHTKFNGSRLTVLMSLAAVVIMTLLVSSTMAGAQPDDSPPVSLSHSADQSTAVSPGETVRFTVTLTNESDESVDSVTVRIDYDESVFPTVEVESSSAVVDDGDVLEFAADSLEAGGTQSIEYRATAAGAFPSGVAAVENAATVAVGDEVVGSVFASVPLAAVGGPGLDPPRAVTELEASDLLLLMLALLIPAFLVVLVVAVLSYRALEKTDDKDRWVRSTATILNLLAVVVIVLAVLILAIRGSIGEDGVISILAGIAGYVLGRSTVQN